MTLSVSRPVSSPPGMAAGPDIAARFRETAFVLGPFPVLSQTFIYRELEAMSALGLEVNVVSTGRRNVDSLVLPFAC